MGLRAARRLLPAPGRRLRVVRLALGALVLAGSGVALTSAAWSDAAYFTAGGSSASVDLRASADGTTYVVADGDSTTTPVGVPVDLSGGLTNLVPGSTVVRTLYLWNAGTSKLTLGWGSAPATALGATCDSVTYSTFPASALPGDSAGGAASRTTATVTITVLDNAPTSCQNRTATLRVVVTGTATP